MDKKKILVFPCGSEIGLEIYESLKYSKHFHLIGGSSVKDHGRFVYEHYIENLPYIDHQEFISILREIISEQKIDAIYPTMDSVITLLKQNENDIPCKIVGSSVETVTICNSKFQTYKKLKKIIRVPKIYNSIKEVKQYPIFAKPDIGYGSRKATMILNYESLMSYIKDNQNYLLLEYLPGDEFTIDCFSDKNHKLLFVNPRKRKRIMNGISVNTECFKDNILENWAERINDQLKFKGAWFFQVKKNQDNDFVLLEVGARIAGSSSICRAMGINLAELSLYVTFNEDVEILKNELIVETDRALQTRYKYYNLDFDYVYVDLDDTILLNNGQLNYYLLSKLYEYIDNQKKIILITKHDYNIKKTLAKKRISNLFDEIIHLNKDDEKVNFIKQNNSIFIDDSFQERRKVSMLKKIPVFSPELVP